MQCNDHFWRGSALSPFGEERIPFHRFGPGPFGLPRAPAGLRAQASEGIRDLMDPDEPGGQSTSYPKDAVNPSGISCSSGLCGICRADCPKETSGREPEKGTRDAFFRINGQRPLSGAAAVHGAKNSVLPIMAAAVLCDSPVRLTRVPRLSDTGVSLRILDSLGCVSALSGSEAVIDPSHPSESRIPDRLVREMRSSVVFLGSVAARTGEASLCLPGGCELGARPIDLHLMGLRALGMEIRERGEKLYASHNGLHGATIRLPFPSVGATENILLAAVLARGSTVLSGAAREPEIVDLCRFLRRCGARIVGEGSTVIYVEGVERLSGAEYEIMPDRIEAATLLACAAAAGGEVMVEDCAPETIGSVLTALRRMGCTLTVGRRSVSLQAPARLLSPGFIETVPFPGFPTDAQPLFTALGCLAQGETVVRETMFESRFRHLPALQAMGAQISVQGREAHITGSAQLSGTSVYAHDLRGGAALVTAALAASGETRVYGLAHIDRGYERLEKTLSALGADIVRIR